MYFMVCYRWNILKYIEEISGLRFKGKLALILSMLSHWHKKITFYIINYSGNISQLWNNDAWRQHNITKFPPVTCWKIYKVNHWCNVLHKVLVLVRLPIYAIKLYIGKNKAEGKNVTWMHLYLCTWSAWESWVIIKSSVIECLLNRMAMFTIKHILTK